MASQFYLIWKESGTLVRDNSTLGTSRFGISFPGTSSKAKMVTLCSSSIPIGEFRTLKNVKLYIDGIDAKTIQTIWPIFGGSKRPDLSGGLDISFDGGNTYTRFSSSVGLKSDPSTWLDIPAQAMGMQGVDGQIGPFDTATIYLKLVIPPSINTQVYQVNLEVDFDII